MDGDQRAWPGRLGRGLGLFEGIIRPAEQKKGLPDGKVLDNYGKAPEET